MIHLVGGLLVNEDVITSARSQLLRWYIDNPAILNVEISGDVWCSVHAVNDLEVVFLAR
jgi:hypothetical protein